MASALNIIVAKATASDPWVADNPVYGHYDYYFYLNAGILAAAFVGYVLVTRRFEEKPLAGGKEESEVREEGEGVAVWSFLFVWGHTTCAAAHLVHRHHPPTHSHPKHRTRSTARRACTATSATRCARGRRSRATAGASRSCARARRSRRCAGARRSRRARRRRARRRRSAPSRRRRD